MDDLDLPDLGAAPGTWAPKINAALQQLAAAVEGLGGGEGSASTARLDIADYPDAYYYNPTYRGAPYIEAPLDLTADVVYLELHGGEADLFVFDPTITYEPGHKCRLIVTSDGEAGRLYLYTNYDDWDSVCDITENDSWETGTAKTPVILDFEWHDPADLPWANNDTEQIPGLIVTEVGRPLPRFGESGKVLTWSNDSNDFAAWQDNNAFPSLGGIVPPSVDLSPDAYVSSGGMTQLYPAPGRRTFLYAREVDTDVDNQPRWYTSFQLVQYFLVDTAEAPLVFAQEGDTPNYGGYGPDGVNAQQYGPYYALHKQDVPITWIDEPEVQPSKFILKGILVQTRPYYQSFIFPGGWFLKIEMVIEE